MLGDKLRRIFSYTNITLGGLNQCWREDSRLVQVWILYLHHISGHICFAVGPCLAWGERLSGIEANQYVFELHRWFWRSLCPRLAYLGSICEMGPGWKGLLQLNYDRIWNIHGMVPWRFLWYSFILWLLYSLRSGFTAKKTRWQP